MTIEQFAQFIRDASEGSLAYVSTPVIMMLVVVGGLLLIASLVALIISIFLAIAYIRYNRRKNSLDLDGEHIARKVLDLNGLGHIKVSATGSILFGNSYSHYFKRVRLRRLTWRKKSVSALAMAVQKSSLAVLDKENDPDMRKRVILTPIIYFGPVMFVPMVIIGVLIDVFLLQSQSMTCTIALTALGFLFYVVSFVMSVLVLKTEKKAQNKAIELMKSGSLATDEEIVMCRKLFRLYNIEYINNMVIALLELIYRVLQIVASVQNSKGSSSSNT